MRAVTILLALALARSSLGQALPGTPANRQLEEFKNSTQCPIGILTTTTGWPVQRQELSTLNKDLITNRFLIEQLSALNRERIPVRVVHGKAAGAFGYFKVTHDVTRISNVAFFSKIGKKTPMVARMGGAFTEKGTADTVRAPFGFAAKFYTEEGNYDFLGFTTDTFTFKDPVLFPAAVRATGRNPKTHLPEPNALFDFLSLRPEALNLAIQFLGDIGIPASFRNMATYAIHTFQVENDRQEISYVRYKVSPDLGVKNLNQSEANRLAGTNPNVLTEDLYNAIENGDYPTYTFGWQVISKRDAKKVPFDIFDVTLRWPENKYPVQPIGKIVLNKNPDDHFRDIEQLAFSPGNLVPGMQGLDKLWEARLFAYRDAALHRMGTNFNNIKVNCPLNQVFTYTRDGSAPVRDTFNGMPNYYPNSFNGPIPAEATRTRTKRTQVYTDPAPTNAGQIADYYRGLDEGPKQRLLENLANNLALVYPSTQAKFMNIVGKIDGGLRRDIEGTITRLAAATTTN